MIVPLVKIAKTGKEVENVRLRLHHRPWCNLLVTKNG